MAASAADAPPGDQSGIEACCCGSCRRSSWDRCCSRRSGSAFPGSTWWRRSARRSWSAEWLRPDARPAADRATCRHCLCARPRSWRCSGCAISRRWAARLIIWIVALHLGDRHRRLCRRPLGRRRQARAAHQSEQDLVGTGRRHGLGGRGQRRRAATPSAWARRSPLAAIGAGLAVVGQVGDLRRIGGQAQRRREGQRHADPGHGGLLDRVDGLIAVLVVVALVRLASVEDLAMDMMRWTAPSHDRPRSVTILGSTGSVGQSTVDLIAPRPRELSRRGAGRRHVGRAAGRAGAPAAARRLAVVANPQRYRALKRCAGRHVDRGRRPGPRRCARRRRGRPNG